MTLRGTFRRPFPEQVVAFRLRLGNLVPTATWEDIQRAEHDQAFVVAGATKADLLADLARAVDRAIAEGETLDTFKRDFRAIVEKHGWHGWTGEGTKAGENWRIKTIYRTNARVSYAAGRLAQLRGGNFPWWIYRHGNSVEPRLQHLSWDRLVLPADHPFWQVAYPPNGWGCSCYVTGARSREAAERRGGDLSKELEPGWDAIRPDTGTPVGIGKGWDYAPGGSTSDFVTKMAEKSIDWRYALATAFFRDLPEGVRDDLQEAYRRLPSLQAKLRRYARRAAEAEGANAQTALLRSEPMVSMGLLTRAQAAQLAEGGFNVRGYGWAVSQERLRHAFRNHSSEALEAQRGQLVLSYTDAGLLPLVVAQPDSARWIGQDQDGVETLQLEREVAGRVIVALFRRRRKFSRLELATMWVRKVR